MSNGWRARAPVATAAGGTLMREAISMMREAIGRTRCHRGR